MGKTRALALLTYLTLRAPHRFQRGMLATLLWQDKPSNQARSSLRQTLAEIRKALPDGPVTIEHDYVGIATDHVSVDIQVLVDRLTKADIADELLEDSGICDSVMSDLSGIGSEFDAWISEHRFAFEARLNAELESLTQSDALPAATRLKAARAMCRIDPLNEEGCRLIMRLSAQRGETGAALMAYCELYDRLDEELGMEPSAQTQDLAVQIKTGAIESYSPAATNAGNRVAAVAQAPTANFGGPPTVAVFPFNSLGPDDVPAFFLNGIVEDTVCMLATLRELRVISSNSTRQPVSATLPALVLCQQLGADYAILGTIRSSRNQFHIAVQMVEVETGLVEWARTYTAQESDLFDVQIHIAGSIANKLVPSLELAELRRTHGYQPADLTAYHLTLRAKDIAFRLERASFGDARELLQMASERDPGLAPTFIAMTDWYSVLLGQGWSDDPQRDYRQLDLMAASAVRLSGESGRALAMYAHNQVMLARGLSTSIGLVETALEQAPNDAEALLWSVPTLAFANRSAEAVEYGRKAIELSPRDPYLFRYYHFLSIANFAAGDFQAAADCGRKSFELNVNYTSNLRMTAAALVEIGDLAQARELAAAMVRLDPSFSVQAFRKKQPFSDLSTGERYAQRLIEAGLPVA